MIKAEKLAGILNEKNNEEVKNCTRILNKVITEFSMEINDKSRELVVDLTDEICAKFTGKIDKYSNPIAMKIKHIILVEIAENLLI